MKKKFKIFLSILLVSLLCSCSQIIDNYESSLSFSVDDIVKEVARNSSGTKCTISISITGLARTLTDSKDFSFSDIEKKKTAGDSIFNFEFNNLPVGRSISIDIRVKDENGFLIYDGRKDNYKVTVGENTVPMMLDEAGWYVLWQKYNRNVEGSSCGWAENPNPKFAIYDHMPTGNEDCTDGIYNSTNLLIDFCFDENQNLYTVEADANYDKDSSHTWIKKHLYIKKYVYGNATVEGQILHTAASGVEMKSITTDGEYVYILGNEATGAPKIFSIPCNGGSVESYDAKITGERTYSNVCIETDKDSKYIFIAAKINENDEHNIFKFDKTSKVIQTVNNEYATLDLPYCKLTDMKFTGGKLYLILTHIYNEELSQETGCLYEYKLGTGDYSNLNPDKSFVCPRKFIALKPKKLVIASDGRKENKIDIINLSNTEVISSSVKLNNINFDAINASGTYYDE